MKLGNPPILRYCRTILHFQPIFGPNPAVRCMDRMRIAAIPAMVVTVCATAAFAQPVSRKEPAIYAGTERASRVEARAPGIRLGLRKPREFVLAPLSASETMRLAQPDTR